MSCHHHDDEHHHHHHHGDECCGCGHHHHHHHKQSYAHELLALADEAWMEVLKEKIKDQIRATSSHHLDQLAKLVSDSNHYRWKDKMEEKSNEEDFETKLRQMLHKDQRK